MKNKKKGIELDPQQFVDKLTELALSRKTETCSLCGDEVVSVALHYLACRKLEEARNKK